MINGKVIMFCDSSLGVLQDEINAFLSTIDIRQAIKFEYTSKESQYTCMIVYVGIEDIRHIKLDNILGDV